MPSTRKKATSARRAPTRARSTSATAARPPAESSGEKGTSILDTFLKTLEREAGVFEKAANPTKSNVRLLIGKKSFGEYHPPRATSLHVKIPRHMAQIEKDLPKDHGFKKSEKGWGLTKTLRSAAEAAAAAKVFAVAAKAVREQNTEEVAA